MERTYQGGCHCNRVRFSVRTDAETVLDCNCSICRKKGLLHLIVPKDQFTLLSGKDALTTYTFGTHTAKHTFCRHCGVQAFYTPRSHPDGIDVNAYCLDDDAVKQFRVESFDGRNWEQNVDSIR